MEGIQRLLSRVGLIDTLMAWLAVAAWLMLFVPESWLGGRALFVELRPMFSLTFIVSCAYFISRVLILGLSLLKQHITHHQHLQRLQAMTSCLDHTERAVLREYVINRKSVLSFPIGEPAVKNLLDNGVLELADLEQNPELRSKLDLKITLDARPLLSFKILGLPVGRLSEEQLEALKARRPRFLRPEYQANRTHNGKLFRIRAEAPSSEHAA